MKKLKIGWLLAVMLMGTATAMAQEQLTIEKCRQLATETNPTLKAAQEKIEAAEALRKMALTQFFPKFDANGAYIWNQKDMSIISSDQRDKLNNLGGNISSDLTQSIEDLLGGSAILNPALLGILSNLLGSSMIGTELSDVGQEISNILNMDFTQIMGGSVSVVQPVYLGGKLRSIYNTAELNSELKTIESEKIHNDLMIAVEVAYWEYLSLTHKEALAQKYHDLLEQLNENVEIMMEAEVATKGDLANVRVKLNEAQMNLTKAKGGVALAKLALCQMCGLDLEKEYELVEDTLAPETLLNTGYELEDVFGRRSDMRMLRTVESIAGEGVKMARSGLLPNIAVTGSYLITNPNFTDGYRKEFGGMFTAGVAMNIPLCHAGDIYALKAAKHKKAAVGYEIEEAERLVRLDLTRMESQLEVSNIKLDEATSNMEQAEENLLLADESFKAGLISTTDLMAAQTAWMKAQSDKLDAEIEVRLNRLKLNKALGNK